MIMRLYPKDIKKLSWYFKAAFFMVPTSRQTTSSGLTAIIYF